MARIPISIQCECNFLLHRPELNSYFRSHNVVEFSQRDPRDNAFFGQVPRLQFRSQHCLVDGLNRALKSIWRVQLPVDVLCLKSLVKPRK